jgi:hypothetical protein
MWCFDCEVFFKDWMFVFIDPEDLNRREIIINDSEKLNDFYNNNKEQIFVGYNARSYDQFIFKAILCGIDPKKVNDYIIIDGNKGGTFSKKFKDIELLIYDCMIDKTKSLKQLEAFMGNDIRETSVDFNLTRKLTKEEIELTVKYCTHDVEQTIEVFKRQPEELESQTSLVEAFDLPKNYMNKTKAQLSAIILGAKNECDRFDDFDITLPDTRVVSEKYSYIVKWYESKINMNYSMSLQTKVYGVPHIFAWGGIHGAISNYSGSGFYVMSDVASLYPSIMIEYGYLSRNVPDMDSYRRIRDKRLELKKAKNPMQLPYKIVLNGTYGAMKDKYNQLYDPLMANNVCVTGQILLLDLIDKIEQKFGDKCELIQSNTDGILVKLPSKEYYDEYVSVCDEWSKRTRLDLEHDVYVTVYQKDVNNYVIMAEDGHYKSKGAYVKKLNDLDYDLPIVNKALVQKLVHDIPVEETINKCTSFKDFQKVVKIGRDYEFGMHGESELGERVLRIYASKEESDGGIFKFRNGKADKVGNTPEIAFIYNDDVNSIEIPNKLDKDWYINLANKRYADFMEVEEVEDKLDVYELIDESYMNFTDVIKDVLEKSICKTKEFKNLILIGYFARFGSIKKLLRQLELYKALYGKKSMTKERLIKLDVDVDLAANFGKASEKSITKLNGTALYDYLVSMLSEEEYTPKEIVKLQLDKLKYVCYENSNLSDTLTSVYSIDSYGGRINLILRSLKNGKRARFVIYPENGDVVQINEYSVLEILKFSKIQNSNSKSVTWALLDWKEVE